ncbi:UDP-glycosyltransferase UGT5-like [Venturia canescens]|uniref:UDP-glycosyltransferase UGT5-like n=1 Tax=Venturia canescens TaxID=32260 RepID=UPI001C9D6447|nr:UDP-glycosyltransferase UGT5-like [Venturia canescens]
MIMKIVIFTSILFILTILNCQSCNGYRILGIFPLTAKSHFIMFEAMMKGLARKGHQVDVISTFPLHKPFPNYTDIIELSSTLPKFVNKMSYDMMKSYVAQDLIHFLAVTAGTEVCKNLGHPEMLKLYRNPPRDPPYDIMITEYFTTNCFIAVGHKLKIPVVGMSSALLYSWLNGIIANPPNLAFMPNNFLDYSPPMNFWQRLWNTVYTGINIVQYRWLTRDQDIVIREIFGNDVPSLQEFERDIALVLINTHISLNGARPITPALVEIGGLHIEDDNLDIPKDLKAWMDDSKEGFVYFTFGSMVTIETFPVDILQAIYKSLKKFAPIRVLLKIVDRKKLPPGLPENIRTFVWAPQLEVLKHKNIKAFITHGGLMGTQEAIYCGVPMIGIPLFIDQFTNIDLYVSKKIAVKIRLESISEDTLDHALKEILYNPMYKKNVMEISTRFRDRPMSPMDTAVWWVEYIARYGNKALRSPALDLAWWQIDLLDVYLFLLVTALIMLYFVIILLRFIVRLLTTINGPKNIDKKKVN